MFFSKKKGGRFLAPEVSASRAGVKAHIDAVLHRAVPLLLRVEKFPRAGVEVLAQFDFLGGREVREGEGFVAGEDSSEVHRGREWAARSRTQAFF